MNLTQLPSRLARLK